MVIGAATLRSGFSVLAHFFGASGAFGHPVPRVLGAQAAVADVVESRCAGVGAGLGSPGEIELKLGGHWHLWAGTGRVEGARCSLAQAG